MIMKDYIPLISVVVVVIGWFVNNILSRKHEIAKRRLEYRLGALESFLPVWFTMQKYGAPFEADPDLLKKIETARSNIQLYGKQDEIDGIERFIECLESNDVENGVKNLHKFIVLIKSRIRGELNIK
ncbi:hypothetical protein [Bacterioplanoides sp.]|uniref:hypothetical protein n=1 Tax=Bacterioplanoides sp. TaxID=2066072 RepID=UPI003B0034AE